MSRAGAAVRLGSFAAMAATVLLGAPLAGCGSCEPEPRAAQPDASVARSFPAVNHPSGTVATVPSAPRTSPMCRALTVDGDVLGEGDGGAHLAAQDEVHPEDWLVLAPGARLVVKNPRSARETTFRGPGRVRACVDSLEESWLAAGTFESSSGSGESPGAEEWVVTPLGVVRFGAAQLSVEVQTREVRVRLAQGVAFLWLAADVGGHDVDGGLAPAGLDEGWTRMTAAQVSLFPKARPTRPPLDAARTAVGTCSALATAARDRAVALLGHASDRGGDAHPRDGAAAGEQVTTRRLAHAACAVAAVRVDALPAPEARTELAAALSDASSRWRTLPDLR